MMTKIPLPKVWDKNLNYIGEIRPIKVSATIKLVPLSYASLQLPKGVNVPARGFVELFSSMGSLGIFRVRSPQDAYGDDITTAELEHAITEVGDYLVLGSYDEMMPANQAFTTIFSHYRGNHWQLGSVAALGTDQIAVQADHVRVLECLISLLEQKTDCMMAFDFSTTPWTLNFVKRDTVVSAEGRLARNVNFAKVSYDDTELCTRAYFQVSATEDADPSGFPAFNQALNYSAGSFVAYGGKLYRLPVGHSSGATWGNTQKTLVNNVPSTTWQYVDSDTIGTYGIVEKEVYSGGDYTDTEVLRIVQDFLNKHKEPRVSVEISAEELSSITGEPFDTFTIGKLCRLALVDYGVTIERTITGLSWDNVYGDPLDITVNLADEEDTAINFLHDVDMNGGTIGGSGGGGGGGGKKKQEDVWKEYRTKFQQTDYYFDLSAARYNRSEEILQQAGLYIDANGVLLYADDNEKQIGSRFKVAADAITAEVQRATGAEAGLKSSIKVEADKISLVVEGTGANARIKPASIVAAINDGESTIKISADHIQLDGNTIATYLRAVDLSVMALTVTNGEIDCDAISCGQIGCTGIDTNEGNVYCGAIDCDSIQSNGASLNVADISKSGNTLTITKVDGSTITFSKATTLSGGWSSGKFTVTASQGETYYATIDSILANGAVTYDNSTKLLNVPLKVMSKVNGGGQVNTGYTTNFKVVGGLAYNAGYVAGWNASRLKVSRDGDTIYRPKVRSGTDATTDVGTEAYCTAILDKGSAWGKAYLYRREKTSAGTGNWYRAENYDSDASVTSGSTTYYFKASGGYWGWNTEPSISWS